MIYWYSDLTSVVKWNDVNSFSFTVGSGVRQGVLSPHLFAIYVNDLILTLRKLNVGCHVIDIFLASIIYADDICLMAPCRSSLQILLNACESYGLSWCLSYNPSKSRIMQFGKNVVKTEFTMYGNLLEFVNEYKYLGVFVVAGKQFSTSHTSPLIKFRSAANTVLNAHSKPSEDVLMKLLYAKCVPIMTYSCESISYSTKQFNSLNVAMNNCIRRIFGYNRWESVRFLRLSMGYPSITDIFYRRRERFLQNIPLIGNPTLHSLINVTKEA